MVLGGQDSGSTCETAMPAKADTHSTDTKEHGIRLRRRRRIRRRRRRRG
jgi:hypothetical protein